MYITININSFIIYSHMSSPILCISLQLEGKYTECPNPQITENHACDRQSGLNDSAPWNHILVAWGKVA